MSQFYLATGSETIPNLTQANLTKSECLEQYLKPFTQAMMSRDRIVAKWFPYENFYTVKVKVPLSRVTCGRDGMGSNPWDAWWGIDSLTPKNHGHDSIEKTVKSFIQLGLMSILIIEIGLDIKSLII